MIRVRRTGCLLFLLSLPHNSQHFYRAMLCIAPTMPSQDVCPPVCPSVTRGYCVKTAKHIVKLFSPSGSHNILVFPYQTVWQYSDGKPPPPNGGRRMQVRHENLRFSTTISLYFGNDTKLSHNYYGRRIGNPTQAFEWY